MMRSVVMGGLSSVLLGGVVLMGTWLVPSEPRRATRISVSGVQVGDEIGSPATPALSPSGGERIERSEAGEGDAEPGLALFRKQIRPLLANTCLKCHNSEDRKGGLDLSRRATALAGGETGPAIVLGKPSESLAFQLVTAAEMPPDFQDLLSSEQITAFKEWIELGAPYEAEPVTRADDGPETEPPGTAMMCPCMKMMNEKTTGGGPLGGLPLSEPLTEEGARQRAAGYLQSWGNPYLKIGRIQETLVSYEVQVVTKENSPVNWIIVDKQTGNIKTLY